MLGTRHLGALHRRSRDPKAAVYDDCLPGEVVACWRGKKNSRSNEVNRVTASAHRHTVVKRSGESRIIEQRLSQLRLNIPRSEAVHTDAFCCPLHGQGTRYTRHAALARRIGRAAARAHLSSDTADVNDLALSSIVFGGEATGLDPISADGLTVLLSDLGTAERAAVDRSAWPHVGRVSATFQRTLRPGMAPSLRVGIRGRGRGAIRMYLGPLCGTGLGGSPRVRRRK